MNRYELSSQIGDGTFGRVMKATSKDGGEVVAIKHIRKKFKTWKACVDLREVQSLRMMGCHPNIVLMKEVIRESDESLYFVFESYHVIGMKYLPDGTLYDLMKKCTNTKSLTKTPGSEEKMCLTHERIVSIMKQIFLGLSHMNRAGFFHRDIKPENILVDGDIVKVADFGLAREIRSHPPFTYYVSTRWYRAPEVILHSSYYGPPIDMFACGLLLSELYTLQPLFPGTSEIDQIHKMTALLGPPTEDTWSEGMQLMTKMNVRLPHSTSTNDKVDSNADIDVKIESIIRQSIRGGLHSAAHLIRLLIQWNPLSRPNADDALRHEYFGRVSPYADNIYRAVDSLQAPKRHVGDVSQEHFERRNGDNFHYNEIGKIDRLSRLANGAARRVRSHQHYSVDQPNEFCDYLNAISTSGDAVTLRGESVGVALESNIKLITDGGASQRTAPREDPLHTKSNISARYRRRPNLSGMATTCKEDILTTTENATRSSRRVRKRSLTKSSNRRRTAEKPRWLLTNQNMGKGAIEVQVYNTQHALDEGDTAPNLEERQDDIKEIDSVWNPF
ncbi:hypothetical protein ACHAWX_006018 [Stephanocyclus meneghinianus]